MSHVRQQIRDYVAGQLAGIAELSNNVFPSRVHQIDKFPGALVYSLDEASEVVASGYHMQRELTVRVIGYVKINDTVDDELDDLSSVIEAKLAADPQFGGLAKTSFLNSTEIELTGDGEEDAGTVTMNYVVIYMTAATDPQIAI